MTVGINEVWTLSLCESVCLSASILLFANFGLDCATVPAVWYYIISFFISFI
jgi:hypothetical protein